MITHVRGTEGEPPRVGIGSVEDTAGEGVLAGATEERVEEASVVKDTGGGEGALVGVAEERVGEAVAVAEANDVLPVNGSLVMTLVPTSRLRNRASWMLEREGGPILSVVSMVDLSQGSSKYSNEFRREMKT